MYNSISDAKTALINSGVFEMFSCTTIVLDDVYRYMYFNDATPDQAADYFEVY